MNNNQNYQPPQGQPNRQMQQQNGGTQQPQQGFQQPNQGWQQQPQGFQQPPQGFQQPYGAWQQPPKKKMSTGCIVGLVLGIIFLLGVGGILAFILIGAMAFNSVTQEFDSIGSELYNTAFELYLGEDKPANSVYKLMASVEANNEDEDETNIIDVEIELNDGTVLNYSSYDYQLIPENSLYDIEAKKNNKGYINKIEIDED